MNLFPFRIAFLVLHPSKVKQTIVSLCVLALVGFAFIPNAIAVVGSSESFPQTSLTPLQSEIQKQKRRLDSPDVEERRDALMRLGTLRHVEASRVAAAGLNDTLPIVRATATNAVLWLPPEERAALLIPILTDKDWFVRQEATYAVGHTRSRSAVGPLTELLLKDKIPGVRGAAAVALGEIGNADAVPYLSSVLSAEAPLPTGSKSKKREQNVFVLRAAARSLGQIASRQGVAALAASVRNQKVVNDVRREAAIALGIIGDSAAVPALQEALASPDPYLSEAAFEALRKISSLTAPPSR